MSDTVIEEVQDAEPTDFTVGSDADAIRAAEEMPVEKESGGGKVPPSLRGAYDFWLVWSGQSVSMLGDGLYGIAMAWWITQELKSPIALAGYALCWFIPTVTLPFVAGSLVDRTSRKALIVTMDSLQGLAVTLLAILLATGNLLLWHVYLGAVILAACGSIHGPALDASIPNLVPKDTLPRANGIYATSQSVSNIAGPLFGGTLVGLVGLPMTMFINALTFWIATVATLLARIPSPRVKDESGQSAFRRMVGDATYGYKWIWEHRAILYLLLIFTTCNFLMAPTYPLEALIINNQLQASGAALGMNGAFVFGLVSTAMAVGTLLSALFFSRGFGIKPMAWGVCAGWTVGGLAAISFGLSTSVLLTLVIGLFMGMSGPLCNIPSQTIWMSYTPDTERGRIFSARRTIAWGVQPVSIALGGWLADNIGAPALFVGSGSIIVLIALGNLLFNQKIRSLYAPDLEPSAAKLGLLYKK